MTCIRPRRLYPAGAIAAFTAFALPLVPDASASGPGNGQLPVMTVHDAVAYESDGVIRFPLTLDRAASKNIRVVAVPKRGTARPGRDYRPAAVNTVIPAGSTEGFLDVRIRDNDVAGPDVRLKLRISAATRAVIGNRLAHGVIRDDDPLTVKILHVNDQHSHLQADRGSLDLGTSGGSFNIPFGGFPRVTAKILDLASTHDNVVKVHAGDAITGTLFYTLFAGSADAELMNTACFDIFALGNHEFDDGDAGLAQFLDALNSDPGCQTATLAANVVPEVGTPLAPNAVDDYIRPYVVKEFQGQKVGFIGLVIAQKTSVSSQPLDSTLFLDEVETAQRYVDELTAMGVDNIVLVTHYGYQNDLALAGAITGVDAIIGGDSHSLLGDFSGFGLGSAGPYPTWTRNKAGEDVCVAQAWQYSWLLGELDLTFRKGRLADCAGIPHLLLGDEIARGGNAVAEPELSEIRAVIEAAPQLGIVTPDPVAQAILEEYAVAVDELSEQPIGAAGEALCLRRVPNRERTNSVPECNGMDVTAVSGASMANNGGFIQQIVTDAFLARAFRADLALQNAGGVRVDFPAGTLTIADAYTLLPFSNTLVELELSGAEIVASLEEAVANFRDNGGSDGSYPYGSGIRWDVDLGRPAGNRFGNVEVRDRVTGAWAAIEPAQTYVVVTNSFLAGGGDGYATFRQARDEGRVTDTFINYAQGFVDYVEQDLGGGPVTVPRPEDFSTQSFTAP